jgi:hypothetical protein
MDWLISSYLIPKYNYYFLGAGSFKSHFLRSAFKLSSHVFLIWEMQFYKLKSS